MTPHFSAAEFRVSATHPALAAETPWSPQDEAKAFYLACLYLEPLRAHLSGHYAIDAAIQLLSGKRSPALNTAIEGAALSDHLYLDECAAVDFAPAINQPRALYQAFKYLATRDCPFGQLIIYPEKSFIHLSLPSKRHVGERLVKDSRGFHPANNEGLL